MRGSVYLPALVFLSLACFGQVPPKAPAFDVASVKPSQRVVGKDDNNRIAITPTGLTCRNATLKRLIVEAYQLQPHQVSGGMNWLDANEYDVEAKVGAPASKEQILLMLRTLLADRFRLSSHREQKDLRVYELVVGKDGAKIHPIPNAETSATPGNFRGDLQQFANMLAIQLTIPALNDPGRPGLATGLPVPVLDKTGLQGIYDISVDIRPEIGGDMFTLWQRVLQDKLGLKLESRRAQVEVLVVDNAERIPTAN